MKTQAEIEDLKRQWIADGCWDIEDTEGFEDHRDELYVWRKEYNAQIALKMKLELEKRAKANGLTPEVQRQVDGYEESAEHSTNEAKKLLLHYFDHAGIPMNIDTCGEIEQIVDAIIEASVASVLARLTEERGKN